MSQDNQNNHPNFPASFLNKLYDYTGTRKGASKGFYLVYIDYEGNPSCVAKCDNNATRIAVEKGLEMVVQEGLEDGFDEDWNFDDLD